ncbi:DUF6904 family protein [Desulfitibacter alkalitolerans]|uniref:DUF6904 family protein n=1 Tax=Desulfitibacter alkalitolerans TaxID=264641 RepID=UPI0004827194|nr:hypothetical protein [Desulfitibacter alkalitolerans]
MLIVRNTENLAGVSISGDFYDLDKLVEALYTITIDEFSEKHTKHIRISTRVLGLCYDVRHALQGDREVELLDNEMDEDKMKFHSIITPKKNVYYKCNYLYPEMFFVMLALNELVKIRYKELSKSKSYFTDAFDKNVIWDDTIATIRGFQGEVMKCVKEILSENAFARWLKLMNSDYIYIQNIAGQYIDLLNIKYIAMDREKRLKNFNKIAKRIVEFSSDTDHNEIKKVVVEAAKEYGTCEGNIRIQGVEYPDDVTW